MRITVRISSAGNCWHPDFPKVDADRCMPTVNGKPRFDRADFLRQIAKFPQVLVGSKDHDCSLGFAALLISSVNDWMDDSEREDDGETRRIDSRLSRRQQSGNVSFCRIDITSALVSHKGGTFRVPKVSVSTDDNGVVQKYRFERDFAMMISDFCRAFSDRGVKAGNPPIVLMPSVQEYLAELHERTLADERKKSNAVRTSCPNYRNGQCSPCKFDCPHYKDGRCVEI